MFKHYGLEGITVKVRHKHGHTPAYPWFYKAVPVLIEKETKGYLVGRVLPHRAPGGFGPSLPYRVTMNKFDIEKGIFIISH